MSRDEVLDGVGAILFDAGGVFILPDATVLGPALVPFGGSTDLSLHRRAHYAAMKAKSDEGHLEAQWGAYHRTYALTVGVRADRLDDAAELLEDIRSPRLWRQPVPESVAALRRLEALGMPMGVVSNAAGQVEDELGRLGICQVGPGHGVAMRVIVDSHVVGVAKPDPKIFEHALDHFRDIERSRILYVGDSVTMDVIGSTAAGLRAVLIDPYDDHEGERFARIGSLVDLC